MPRLTALVTLTALLFLAAGAGAQSVSNGQVTVTAATSAGRIVGFDVRAGEGFVIPVRFGSGGNIWAARVKVERTAAAERLRFAPLVSAPTPRLGRGSQVLVELRPRDLYPRVSFTLELQSFNRKAWEDRFGTVPFHFLCLPMPGAELFYHRGWQIPTPVLDPYPMQGKQTGYGKQIRSDWDDDWTYAPPLGAHPLPDVGLWWPSKKLFACYDFHEARLTDHTEKDIATAYVWRQGPMQQFICLAWPYAGGYRTQLRYPEKLPTTIGTHFYLLWSTDASGERDPNLIVQEFVWGRWANLLPEVPRVNDLSWLSDAYRPQGYGPKGVGKAYYGRVTKDNARWWKAGTLVFWGLGWDRSDVDYAYGTKDERSLANLRDNLAFMAPRVKWMTIDGERCCAWKMPLEGEAVDMFDGGVPTVHNIQTWQMALMYLDAYRNDPQAYGKYLPIVDGVLRWTAHVLFTRNGYADVPAAQFCWGAAPSVVYCLRYYYTFRNDPQRRELAQRAYRLARNMMYHYLPTWLADNNEMDNLDSFSYCEPNSGISWLGSACSNEVWCVPFAATVAYLATGDPWLAHYVRGACEHWHELYRDEWYATVREYGSALSEQYYLYPGRGPLGGRVTFGGLWGQLEQIAWPVGEATVRVTCGEKAALAWNRLPGKPRLKVEDGRVVRLGPPSVTRHGRHTDIADYRYYGNGQCSFKVVRYGRGQPEPFAVDITFPMFDLRGKPVFLKRAGKQGRLVKGRDYEEMPNRWDTLVVYDVRYGDTIGVGKIDPGVKPLPCAIARVRGPKPQLPAPQGFAIADLNGLTNRMLSFDWEDPDSFAGLEAGRRWIYGVPFDLLDPDFSVNKVGVRDTSIRLSLPGRHLFVLLTERSDDARVTLTAGGKKINLDLAKAVPVLKGWPPCFQWQVDLVETALPGPVTALEPHGCTVLAATTYTGKQDARLTAILDALKERQQEAIAEARTVAKLATLRPLFEKLSGRIAILPPAGKANPRGSALARILQKAGLIKYVVFITPRQLVDPDYFNTARFWIAVYASGEQYLQTVSAPEDGDRALLRFLRGGGTLLVLPTQPFPFYYNEEGKVVVSAPKFGLPINGSGVGNRRDLLEGVSFQAWEKAPRDRKLTFHLNPNQDLVTSLPATFPFPLQQEGGPRVDERWRPLVNVIGDRGKYVPILTLKDDRGKVYGDGAAMIEYTSGPVAPGRVIYVWTTLLAMREYQQDLLADVIRWTLTHVLPPPSQGRCYFTHRPVKIDGVLDDAAWREVKPFTLQRVINTDAPGTNQPTEVYLRWDSKNLYVAFVCQDSDVWATMKQRDQHLWEEEVVEVFVDPEGDGKNYKEFEVNPLNTVVDLNIPRPGHSDLAGALAWDSKGWQTAVKVTGTVGNRGDKDTRWVCEMAIPLADLAPPDARPRPGDTWRVNLYRIDRPNKADPKKDVQFSAWSAVQKGYHEPRHFGLLTFAGDPYDDDFSLYRPGRAPTEPWVVSGGEWQVVQGGVVGRNGGTDGWFPTGLRGGLPFWTDYR
ncbi:MAG: carbohydrate-binding family 9-like protein, partial [Armatimonadetes bacterium]|nr:carbohydrate-binding family 9-like protein [Armatimonadota bacterium]